jgi:pyruvate/2-oxoglutarate dehydrogenase complex dihydrolipoamide acyltransferase (E2) component
MAFVFPLPEIGEGVVEGEVVAWKVAVGDAVRIDQPLCDVMTDKATVEISSPRAGTVKALFGKPGDIIKVHAPLLELDDNGTSAPSAPAPKAHAAAPSAHKAAAPAPAPAGGKDTRAAPAVRRHAREEGVDIGAIAGTGAKGRVTHADVEAAARGTTPLPKAPTALPQVRSSGQETRVKLIGLRRKIAEQMVKSKRSAPHFTYVEEVDATRLFALREQLKVRAEAQGVKLTTRRRGCTSGWCAASSRSRSCGSRPTCRRSSTGCAPGRPRART